MYNYTLHRDRKHISRCCIQCLGSEQTLQSHVNDCFEINGKQMIKRAKKCKTINFKNYIRTIKSPFMIYANFKSILVTENNGEQNPDESYTINQNWS